MWGQLGNQVNAILNPIVAGVAGTLAGFLAPLLVVFLTTWILSYAYRFLAGSSDASVPAFVGQAALIIAIGTLGTSAGFITGTLMGAWDGVRAAIALAFVSASATPINPNNPWTALDLISNSLGDVLSQLYKEASKLGWTEIPEYLTYFAAFLILGVCGSILLVVCGFLIALSSFLGAFAFAVAPMFIFAAAFQWSRQYFQNWLTFILNVALLSSIAMFAIAVSLNLSNWVITSVSAMPGGIFNSTVDMLRIILSLAAVHIMLAILVFQGPATISQMLGAAGIGQGGSFVSTMLMLTRLAGAGRAASSAGGASAAAGGSVSRGGSAAYSAGRAAGRMTAEAGRGAGYAYQAVASRLRRR